MKLEETKEQPSIDLDDMTIVMAQRSKRGVSSDSA